MPTKTQHKRLGKAKRTARPVAKRSRAVSGTDANRNAIPQKALLHVARIAKPPAISDDIPDQMPFDTTGQ